MKEEKNPAITWHPATKSPGKRAVVIAFTMKTLPKGKYFFKVVRFRTPDVEPATVAFKTDDGAKMLAVAWAYYDEVINGITDKMVAASENHAWAWWPDDLTDKNQTQL